MTTPQRQNINLRASATRRLLVRADQTLSKACEIADTYSPEMNIIRNALASIRIAQGDIQILLNRTK